MRYLNIVIAASGEIWAIEEVKLREISHFLALKSLSDEPGHEVEARVGPGQRRAQQPTDAPGSIAVLPVYGVLAQRMNMMIDFSGGTSMQMLANDLRAALADPKIKAIILDIDSPGGTVSGTQELGQEIFDSRGSKPIVAMINSMAASAAYWLACQCDEIVVTPSGQAGSIGVYTVHENLAKMLDAKGIDTTLISAGKYKTEGNPYGPLGEEAAAAIQARVNQSYSAFVGAVARGRGISRATVAANYGQGRMFGAAELVDRGMANRIATLPQTLEAYGASIHPVATASTRRAFAAAAIREMHQNLASVMEALKVRR